MLFPLARHWVCQIQQHQVTMSCGDQSIYKVSRQSCKDVWQAIEALFSLLPDARCLRDTVEFIIDIPEVHYIVMPWEEGLTTPAQLRNYTLSFIMREKDINEDLAVSFLDSAYGKSHFAALIDKRFIAFLTDTCRRYRMRIFKFHTYFGYYFSQRKEKIGDNTVYICAGACQTTFAVREAGSWSRVFSLHLPEQKIEEKIRKVLRVAGIMPTACELICSCNDGIAKLNSVVEL